MKTALRLLLAPYRFSVANLFRMGEQGGVYYPDNPDSLLRRVNLLSSTATLSTQSITATPRQQTLSFKGTGTVTLSGASTAGPLVGTGASDRVSLTFTPTAASLTLTVTGTVTEAQLELGPAFTTYQPVTTWTTDYMAAVGHLVTQFTDSAGTTPVTKVTDPVGLTLDRRFGGARGVELFADGGFSSGVSDLPNSARGTVALGSNTAVLTTTSVATTEFGVVAGAVDPLFATAGTYDVQIVVSGWSVVNSIHRLVAYASQSFNSTLGGSFTMNGVGTYSGRLTVAAGDTLTIRSEQGTATIGDVFTLSRISARLVPGNHRIQATSGSRKTLSARYNLLLATATMATQNVTTVATSYKLSFTGTGTVTLSGTSTAGPLVGTGANDRVSLTFTPTAGTLTLTVSGSVTLADLRTADDAAKAIPAYQRVNTASDYDTDGFYHANVFDGTDDNDTCATGGGNTSGLMLVSAITVQGGAGTNRVIWSDIGTNTGWRVRINTSNQLEISAGNGSAYTTIATTATLPVGETHVISAWEDGANLCVQIDNGAVASTAKPTISAGTAGFTIGKENGAASGYFFGRVYDLVARWSGYNPTEHARLKTWAARLAGMTL